MECRKIKTIVLVYNLRITIPKKLASPLSDMSILSHQAFQQSCYPNPKLSVDNRRLYLASDVSALLAWKMQTKLPVYGVVLGRAVGVS